MRNKVIVRYHDIIVKLRKHVIKAITELCRPYMQATDINCTTIWWVRTTEQDTESPTCDLMKLSEESRENFSESRYNSMFNSISNVARSE